MSPVDRVLSFLASTPGRWSRIGAGVLMIAGGIASATPFGWVVAGLGAVPILAASLDVCLPAPLFGRPFDGHELRQALGRPEEAPLVRRPFHAVVGEA